jgi:translation initiation factor IF-2
MTPPVVSVLGHVDHGKTTLLDAIRSSHVADREHGGITQRIGASSVAHSYEGAKQMITFIDTPGHEAFAAMRSRGAQVADIGLLVVSAVDGVKPQTREAIGLLRAAQIPFIVVLTKIDLTDGNTEKVRQQLLAEQVLLEQYGGDVPLIEVSARTGHHIQELLDLILLVASMKVESAKETDPLKAVVIESRLDPKSGARASVIVKAGTLSLKDMIYVGGEAYGKVRSLTSDAGGQLTQIHVGEAAEILGFEKVPSVGSIVRNQTGMSETSGNSSTGNQVPQEGKLSLILCADTLGSLEAIQASLPEGVVVLIGKTGDVSEGDVVFAKQTGAFILTFNTKLKPDVIKYAQNERVVLKNYTIIYEMLDEIGQVIEGKAQALIEQIFGVCTILASFPFEKTTVLGLRVDDGRIAKGDKVRIMRADTVVGESMVVSLRIGKDTVSKVEKGHECGAILSPLIDFTIGDVVLSHS